MKKVVIKINDEGTIEIVSKDKDVAIVLQYPDGAEVEMHAGDKKIWKNKIDSDGTKGRFN